MENVAPVAPVSAPAPVASAPVDVAPVATPAPVVDSAPAPVAEPVATPAPAPTSMLDAPPEVIAPVGDIQPAGDVIHVEPQVKDWREDLPLEYKNNPNINKYKSLDDLMNGQLNLVKKLGEKGIQIPSEDADQATWDAYYTRTGRPESSEDYSNWESELMVDAEGNELPKFDLDPEMYKEAKDHFHGMGLTDKQQLAVMGFYAKTQTQGQDAFVAEQAQMAQQAQSDLRQEFGDKYDSTLRSVSAVADSLGIKETLVANGLGNNADIIRMLHKVSGMVGESRLTGDVSPAGGGFDQSVEAIKTRMQGMNRSNPEWQTLENKRIALYAKHYNK